MVHTTRRSFIKWCSTAMVAGGWSPALGALSYAPIDPGKPIKIGILFSQTGAEKICSFECYKMALMAIQDINNSGGINGAKLVPIVQDPASDWPRYTKGAKDLMDADVNIVWGCLTLASRKATLPAI